MAKKRARAQKKRKDYRKGGRVGYNGVEGIGGTVGTIEPDVPPVTTAPPATTTPPAANVPNQAYTQSDLDTAVAGLNAGTISAADLATQYGVTEDYVNTNLKTINADTSASIAAIPADGDYSEAETQQVQDAIASGAVTADQAAAQFGVRADQVTQEIRRREAVQTGQPIGRTPLEPGQVQDMQYTYADSLARDPYAATTTTDPVTGETTKTPYEFRNMDAEKAAAEAAAAEAAARAAAAKAAADAANTATEVTSAENTATLNAADDVQLSNVDVATKPWVTDNPATTVDESQAAGAFIQDYDRVDPALLFDDRASVDIDDSATGTVTPDSDVEVLDAYVDITPPTAVPAPTFRAAKAALSKAAKAGVVSPANYNAFLADILNSPQFATDLNRPPVTVDEIRALTANTKAAQFSLNQAKSGLAKRTTDVVISDSSFIDKVNLREDVNLSATPDAEKQTRSELTSVAADSEAAKITDTIGYDAYQRRAITGIEAQDAAIKFTAETAGINSSLAQSIVQDPAKVTAQIDNEPPEVIAAIAALPPEALVSSQMETLLAGMESGTIPTWAKPAVDSINQRLAQRGMDVSTVGRDALFNAVIQSALPIAQSNAQALQARAAQNLSNEQQANLQRAQTEANRRLNNLANRQTAESQTAQFSQNLKVLQSQFTQERDTLSFQQQQEQRLTNLQNQQRTAELNAQNENASVAQNLGNRQQIELANLEIQNQSAQQNMTAVNQERLAEMQVAADFISKNAAFDQQMKTANLSNEQQMRLANLTSRNQAGSENLTTAQQTELANLNARMQTNLTSGNIAAQLGTALLSADQQKAVENAAMVARIDLNKFSDAQQVEIANSKFMQSISLADFNARQQGIMQDATALAGLDMAAADQRTKLAVTQAQNFLQRDMTDLSNQQQALILDTQVEQQRLLSNQASTNVARQFNATSDNQVNQFNESLASQIEQFNAAQGNAMSQFNAAEKNRVSAINAGNAIDVNKFNNQIDVQVDTFNEQQDLQRDQWNTANAQAIEQSNVQWRRQANTINTAAQNATNQENAAKAFQISAADQNFMWQELRDEAAYLRQAYENDEQRATTLYATAISNDVAGTGATGIKPIVDIVKTIIT